MHLKEETTQIWKLFLLTGLVSTSKGSAVFLKLWLPTFWKNPLKQGFSKFSAENAINQCINTSRKDFQDDLQESKNRHVGSIFWFDFLQN